MNGNRQLVNLVGLLLVVAILVAGVALVALPMYAQSRTIDANTVAVEQTNAIYEAQITQLAAADEEIDAVDADLATLRTAIPANTSLDDVFEIIAAASTRADVTISTIKVVDPEQWAPRAGVDTDPEAAAAAEAAADADAAPDPATDDGAAEGTGGSATDEAATDGTAAEEQVGPQPQQQLTVTIEVEVADAEAAMTFVDALGRGKRLIAPIDATLDDGTLTVTVLTFIRTED